MRAKSSSTEGAAVSSPGSVPDAPSTTGVGPVGGTSAASSVSSWSWGSSAVPRRNWSATPCAAARASSSVRSRWARIPSTRSRTPCTEAAISSRAARSCSIWIPRPRRRAARSASTRRRASWTWSRRARPSSLARVTIASPAAIASATMRSLSTRASCSALATSSSTSTTRSAADVSVRSCSSSTWLCVSRSSVAAPSWACTTMRAASSWAWRRIWALCWPSEAVRVASSTTGWAARSSASVRAARSSSSRASSASRFRATDCR